MKTLRTTPCRTAKLGRERQFAVFKKSRPTSLASKEFLQSNRDNIDPELLAAKMCGRWRNGVPLALSPDTDSPAGGLSPEQLNDFGYVNADGSGDPKGCAARSAHTYAGSIHEISRSRVRDDPAAAIILTGWSGALCHTGQPTIRASRYDGLERRISWYFINANIENQYEFVLRQWVNDSEFAGGVRLHPKSKGPPSRPKILRKAFS